MGSGACVSLAPLDWDFWDIWEIWDKYNGLLKSHKSQLSH